MFFPALTNESSCSSLGGTTALYGTGRTAWMLSVPLNLANHPTHVVLDLGCTRSIGSRAAMQKVSETRVVLWHYGTVFGPCNESFMFSNSVTEHVGKVVLFTFRQHVHCLPVDVLETGDVPILFPLSRIKNSGTTIGLDPKRRQIYMSSFCLVLFSSRRFHNGTYCVRLDESCVPAQIA